MVGQIYKGKNVRFSFEGGTLFHATSCKLSVTTKLEQIATKDTNGTVSTVENYEWSISTDALVADKAALSTQKDAMDILGYQLAGTLIDVEFTTGVEDDFMISGQVYVSQSEIDATVGSAVSGSFSFTGTGDLTKTLVPGA